MPPISIIQYPIQMKMLKLVHNGPDLKETVQPALGTFPQLSYQMGYGLSLRKRILIFGTGQLAVDVCQAVISKKRRFVTVVGFLDSKSTRVGERLVNPGIIGTYDEISHVVDAKQIDTIIVCIEDRRSVLPVQTLLDFKAMGLEIIDGHHVYEEVSGRLSIDSLRPSALIFSTGFRRRITSLVTKRLCDILISLCGLVLLSPLFLLVSLLIMLDSPGPVIYRQVRVGLRGRPYLIWKFRSMRLDAEKHGPRWAEADDPRISRVGWWLRKTRIDEFPQLINVLKGEMSLVGPRPERPVFVQDLRTLIPYYDIRHTVRPGITGWAQVKFRYGASQEDSHVKLQYDLFYVKNLSLALDLKILMRTVRVIFFGEGAY